MIRVSIGSSHAGSLRKGLGPPIWSAMRRSGLAAVFSLPQNIVDHGGLLDLRIQARAVVPPSKLFLGSADPGKQQHGSTVSSNARSRAEIGEALVGLRIDAGARPHAGSA
ncbi:hypothetical protein [Mesorhizobium sp.]|uniref:hypothetical protein n=1 Tax=Mesorhizobium sp. TaxID=1871066 RepID=UPI0025F14395|nr:hypothetical protein [Mesorhizobium sp.]